MEFTIPNEKKSRVIINTDAKNEVDAEHAMTNNVENTISIK
jgi:hypothetical protein